MHHSSIEVVTEVHHFVWAACLNSSSVVVLLTLVKLFDRSRINRSVLQGNHRSINYIETSHADDTTWHVHGQYAVFYHRNDRSITSKTGFLDHHTRSSVVHDVELRWHRHRLLSV